MTRRRSSAVRDPREDGFLGGGCGFLQFPRFCIAIRHDVADATHFPHGHTMKMCDVRDSGALHAFDGASSTRFDIARCAISARAGGYGHERHTAIDGKYLHWQVIEQRSRTVHDRKAQRFHIKEPRRARRAQIAVALARGAYDIAHLKARRGICTADAAYDDGVRVGLRKKERHGVRRVDRTNACANDGDRWIRTVEALPKERALEFRRDAKKKI